MEKILEFIVEKKPEITGNSLQMKNAECTAEFTLKMKFSSAQELLEFSSLVVQPI